MPEKPRPHSEDPPGPPVLPGPGGPRFRAIDKPPGDTVSDVLRFFRESDSPDWLLAHRLDRMTSGVLLLARGKEALRLAHEAWPLRVEKTYRALVRGWLPDEQGSFAWPILENRTSRPDLLARALRAAYGAATASRLLDGEVVDGIPPLPLPGRSSVHPAGREARTRYLTIERRSTTSLLELELETGRMHQIRVHLAHAGTPILADPLYDPEARLAAGGPPFLNAARLVWHDPPETETPATWEWSSLVPTPPE